MCIQLITDIKLYKVKSDRNERKKNRSTILVRDINIPLSGTDWFKKAECQKGYKWSK